MKLITKENIEISFLEIKFLGYLITKNDCNLKL